MLVGVIRDGFVSDYAVFWPVFWPVFWVAVTDQQREVEVEDLTTAMAMGDPDAMTMLAREV